jgi:hypothetical protein
MGVQKHGDIRGGALRKVHCASVVGGRRGGSTEGKFVLPRPCCLLALGTRSGLELAPTPWITVIIATCNKTLSRCPASNLGSSPPADLACQGCGRWPWRGRVQYTKFRAPVGREVFELPH